MLRLRYTLQRAGRFCSAREPFLAGGTPVLASRVYRALLVWALLVWALLTGLRGRLIASPFTRLPC